MVKLGIIGYPLGHSISAVIQKAGLASIGLDGSYDVMETPPEDLINRIKYIKSNGYDGFNVTIPLKENEFKTSPVSSFTSRSKQSSGLSPASKCPPTPIHLSWFISFFFVTL